MTQKKWSSKWSCRYTWVVFKENFIVLFVLSFRLQAESDEHI